MAKFENEDSTKGSTGLILLVCLAFAVVMALAVKHNAFVPLGPQPTPSATSSAK